MSKRVIHSKFGERISLSLKAPAGEGPKARALQRLVKRLTEASELGTTDQWIKQVLLAHVQREMIAQGELDPSEMSDFGNYDLRGVSSGRATQVTKSVTQEANRESEDRITEFDSLTVGSAGNIPSYPGEANHLQSSHSEKGNSSIGAPTRRLPESAFSLMG